MTIDPGALGRLGDVQVNLSVEMGRAELSLKEVLALKQGSVVSLNRLTDELLDVTANGKAIARAEIVAQDGRFALRVVEIVGAEADEAAAGWPSDDTIPTQPQVQPAAQSQTAPPAAVEGAAG